MGCVFFIGRTLGKLKGSPVIWRPCRVHLLRQQHGDLIPGLQLAGGPDLPEAPQLAGGPKAAQPAAVLVSSGPAHESTDHPDSNRACDSTSVARNLNLNPDTLIVRERSCGGAMPASLLDGKLFASQIKAEVAEEVRQLASAGMRPGLAAVLVGHHPASQTYVRSKVRSCEELGIFSELITPPQSIETEELVEVIERLNRRRDIDGILIQLPLPGHIDVHRVLLAVSPEKDVDGFHPLNVGNLSTQRPGLVPCTPAGCMEVLRRAGIAIEGQEAVIVGRSDIVGKPLAMLLTNANATVTLCHSRTRDLAAVCRRGDILVAAVGRPGFITTEFIKPGATILDVGINHIEDPVLFERFFKGDAQREKQFSEKGSTIIGDCDPRVMRIAGACTPVPGGIGRLTIAMLMSNTVKAAKLRRGIKPAKPETALQG